jgi:hypothetical protein
MSLKPQSSNSQTDNTDGNFEGNNLSALDPSAASFASESPAVAFFPAQMSAPPAAASPATAASAPASDGFSAMESSVASSASVSAAAPVTGSAASSASSSATVPGTTLSGATGTTASSALPSWINTLSTASIKADISAADVNGTVSYSGLKTLLTDLDATLTSSKSTLTTAEFTDLKTIAANLNNGLATSSYLTSVMNDVVNGSTENKTWTGGAAGSTSLGNLAVGSSATQLSELIGKWVLGTDLPSSSVSMTGASAFSVSYSTSSNAVFGAAGPSMNDINQGYLGDCYLLSSLAEVAKQNAGDITSMFTSNGNNTYGVRFYVGGVAQYVTVNNSLADGGSIFNSGTDIWASLAEKAYAQLQTAGPVTGNSINAGNSWSTIGNGGAPEFALEEITGATAITDFRASGNAWSGVVYNQSFGVTSYSTGNATAAVLSQLASDLAKGDDVILSSYTNATDSSGRATLIADHAMSVYGYDSATGMLEVRNPWGTEAGQSWDTTFEVSLTTLLADGDTITADNAGKGPAPVAPPVLTTQTLAQTWKLGQAVNFTLPSNTFTDPQAQKLSYSAKLSNGAALPSWLTFNSTTGTFSGTVANTATAFSVTVTATDTSGLSASETFAVATPPPTAPALTAQTATQSWKLGQAVNFTLAANTFTDPQAEKITYSATLSNGTALPSWLSFNATTGTFTGTVPNTATGLSIKLTATDLGGASSSETFSVLTPASAPTVTAATAAQSWTTGQAVNFALASNTFSDPQHETLTYSATQANGAALPTWLRFNGTTDTFSGTAPAAATSLSLKVTATDSSGLSVSESFAVNVAAARLAAAISSVSGSNSVTSTLSSPANAASPTLASPLH